MIKPNHLTLAFCLLFFTSCTKMCGTNRADMTPEEVVEAYLDISLNMTDIKDKKQLLELTTGALHQAIDQAPDEVIDHAFVKKHLKLDSYSVVERRDRTPRETEITFELIYRNLGKKREITPENAPIISTENTVSVVREDKVWLIRDVLGKSTVIDFPLQNAEVITNSK